MNFISDIVLFPSSCLLCMLLEFELVLVSLWLIFLKKYNGLSSQGMIIMVTYYWLPGIYPPQVKVYELRELSLKFERHLVSEIIDFQVLPQAWCSYYSIFYSSRRWLAFIFLLADSEWWLFKDCISLCWSLGLLTCKIWKPLQHTNTKVFHTQIVLFALLFS